MKNLIEEMAAFEQVILGCERFATEKHAGQVRKYNGSPYITHPRRIHNRVLGYAFSGMEGHTKGMPFRRLYMRGASWLHDVWEDCDVTAEEIIAVSGTEIFDIVKELTNPSKQHPELNRKQRKAMDFEHISKVSWEAKTLKLFDRIDNLSELSQAGDSFVQKYARESIDLVDAIVTPAFEGQQQVDPLLVKEATLWIRHLLEKSETPS
jgi:(p)ppGpp synthase/HD superfamily hydrolase